jgi:hypothetical protein
VNSSRLTYLALASNRSLGDAFVAQFLPALTSPYLKELHLSVTGLTARAAPHIAEYISSPRCKLRALRCNGNELRLTGVTEIVSAMERGNWHLEEVELYSNGLETGAEPGSSQWQRLDRALRNLLIRNAHLRQSTERDALALLRYSRAALLRPARDARDDDDAAAAPATVPARPPPPPPHPFTTLPPELQLHILSFIAPALSPAQRLRIYAFAATSATLPLIRAPSTVPPQHAKGPDSQNYLSRPGADASVVHSPPLSVPTSRLCYCEEQRERWLAALGCDGYDPRT